jgi:hypothetical protein
MFYIWNGARDFIRLELEICLGFWLLTPDSFSLRTQTREQSERLLQLVGFLRIRGREQFAQLPAR